MSAKTTEFCATCILPMPSASADVVAREQAGGEMRLDLRLRHADNSHAGSICEWPASRSRIDDTCAMVGLMREVTGCQARPGTFVV